MPSFSGEDATVVAAVGRHRHECYVPRCRGAACGAAPVEVHSVWCRAPQSKTPLSSQPSRGTSMSATCRVAEEQLEVLPGRSPFGVVLSSARQDAAVVAAVWRHRHECHVPRYREAARGAARLKSTRRGAELRSRRCRVERPLGVMPSLATGIVATGRHRHECRVPRCQGAASSAAPVKSRLA